MIDDYPCFTVTDLTKDERFNQLPFVTGPPFFRFYAGTPLTTNNGVNIGSLFVIDHRVRPELNEDQVDCLGTIAKIVMQSMQLSSEAAERKRSLKMSQGLQAFQDGKDSQQRDIHGRDGVDYDNFIAQGNDPDRPRTNGDDGDSLHSLDEATSPTAEKTRMDFEAPVAADVLSPPDPYADDNSKESAKDVEQSSNTPFMRSANLLREALDLHNTGGVVFFKADSRYRNREASQLELDASEDDFSGSPRKKKGSSVSSGSSHEHPASKKSDVLSFSTADLPLGTAKELGKIRSFSPMAEHLLHQLLQRYPKGNMWCFDEDGEPANKLPFSASSRSYSVSGRVQLGRNIPGRDRRGQSEARQLRQCFPNGECVCLSVRAVLLRQLIS